MEPLPLLVSPVPLVPLPSCHRIRKLRPLAGALPGDLDKCVREHRRETPRAATLEVPARAPWHEAWHGDSVYEGGRMGDGGVPHAA